MIIWLATSMTSRAQASDATDESWTSTSQNSTANANPYRTTESHVKSGNRTLDKKTVEVRGPDGTHQLYYRTETETIQESPTLTRCITRTYNPNLDRNEHLTQIVEAGTRAQQPSRRPRQPETPWAVSRDQAARSPCCKGSWRALRWSCERPSTDRRCHPPLRRQFAYLHDA